MTACPLSLIPTAEPIVPPEIPTDADILHVGFAPGRDEVPVLHPFVGASGQLLRDWLDQLGLLERSAFANIEGHRTRDMVCYYCGIEYFEDVKLNELVAKDLAYLSDKDREDLKKKDKAKRPTATEQKFLQKHAASGAMECSLGEHKWKEVRANREPHKDEACQLPIIEHLLQQTGRWKVIICWGAVPARVLGGYKGPVGSMVGRFRTIARYGDLLCTVLYHPAYALRQKGSLEFAHTESLIKEVLRQVVDRLEHPAGKDRYPFDFVNTDTIELQGDEVIDIETGVPEGKNPDPRVDIPHTLCVGHRGSDDVQLYPLGPSTKVIVPKGSRFVMHNAQYDIPLLAKLCGHLDFTADDTMVAAYLLGFEPLSLKIRARRDLGRHAREYLEKYGDDDPEYDAQDPHLTRDLWRLYEPQLKERGLWFLYNEVKVPLQRIMARHVITGLKVDQTKLAELKVKMEYRAERLQQHMFQLVGREFNPRSVPTVSSILYDEFRLPPKREWNRQTKEETLVRTTNSDYIGEFRHIPFVSALLAYRRAASYESRYTGPLSEVDRVSGLYDLTGTGTDRVSQSNRNCMNFPLLVKECIEADEGGYFVYGDYSQIELRYAAYFSRDPYLLAVIREGRNMHHELCLAIYGARTPETYTQAKSANFAKLFGAGLRRRAQTLKMSVDVVKNNEVPWPGWDAFVANRVNEPAKTYWGYERNLEDALSSADERLRDKAMRQIINSIIQGSAGETNQYAQVLCDQRLEELGGFVIHQEHDSVLGWVPNSVPEEEGKAALMAGMMAAVPPEINEVIEIPAKVTCGTHWG